MEPLNFDGYKLFHSRKLQKIIKDERCATFCLENLRFVWAVYKSLKSRLSIAYPEVSEIISYPDTQLTMISLESAYLDLWKYEQFHDLEDGPAPERISAAVASWINRWRPVQFKQETNHEICAFFNSIFAFEVGWAIKVSSKMTDIDHEPPEVIANLIADTPQGSKLDNLIIYTMMWRNPSFKDLIPVFELLTSYAIF